MEIEGVYCNFDIIIHILKMSTKPVKSLRLLRTRKSISDKIDIVLSILFGSKIFSKYVDGNIFIKRVYIYPEHNTLTVKRLSNRENLESILIITDTKTLACSLKYNYMDIFSIYHDGKTYGLRIVNTRNYVIAHERFTWCCKTYCMKDSGCLILKGECLCSICQ